jgi:cobalamin-dependent methionine synthase I
MLIVGEKINSTRTSIARAIEQRDEREIIAQATAQVEAGADMLDVNCGTLDVAEEPRAMEWLVALVQQAVDIPVCIDSANADALAAGLAVHRGKAMVNSISGERQRFERVLPLVKQYEASVIALGMDDNGIPEGLDNSLEVGVNVVEGIVAEGVPLEDIYFDPLVRTVATSPESVRQTLILIEKLRERFEGLRFVSGLSNVSFGLPERRHLNRAYAVLSVAAGLDAVILDPLDRTLGALVYATEALVNRDKYCMRYIEAFHQGKLGS